MSADDILVNSNINTFVNRILLLASILLCFVRSVLRNTIPTATRYRRFRNCNRLELAHRYNKQLLPILLGCPEPRVCAKNCFVYINENGCQDCQCLWQSLSKPFKTSLLYCDLGKCNCRIGLRQDMTHSGFCEEDPNFKKQPSKTGTLLLQCVNHSTEVARHSKCRFNIYTIHYA
ncbi:unnamed protein product [Angiostrongylus costaricensis]|uniref:CC domain-containing protein n=1 Tax=Angiostrongylus costaricensis TaxID=334426 RepID=A0A0R3PY25_ANGCS|nr:unnamed protein product [Angiostrongylus costaricensis]